MSPERRGAFVTPEDEKLASGVARGDRAALETVYREMDVLVVPSIWYENSPITIHEAFQFSTPVLVSDIGGMAELVEDDRNGRHFRVGDPEDLARVMSDLVQDLGRLTDHARFPELKSIADNAGELEERYAELLSAPAGRAPTEVREPERPR